MKYKLIFCFFLWTANAFAENSNTLMKYIPEAIYGIDGRMDLYESSDRLMIRLAHSTAAQIPDANLIKKGNTFTLKSDTLADNGVCSNERFINQYTAATCSAFLVSKDTLVTAAHCIDNLDDCKHNFWVFDYANIEEEKSSFTFHKNQIYRCTKIIVREKNQENKNDYAVIKLDRPVRDRRPFTLRNSGKPDNNAILTVIGHPSGLPTKITNGAQIRDNSGPIFFYTNADTYAGNSGSPVVDSRTGIVEGILVRGDSDYTNIYDSCISSIHRRSNEGGGEEVTRITNIKILHQHKYRH